MCGKNALFPCLFQKIIPIFCLKYKYYSFFALENVYGLNLVGFKYPLNNFMLSKESLLGVSNELIEDGKLSFSSGKLILIKTKGE